MNSSGERLEYHSDGSDWDHLYKIWFQLVWGIFLHQDHRQLVPPYGSAAEDFVLANSNEDLLAWSRYYGTKLLQSETILSQIESLFLSLKWAEPVVSNLLEVKRQLLDLTEKIDSIWLYSDFSRDFIGRANSDLSQDRFFLTRLAQDFFISAQNFLEIQKGVLSATERQLETLYAAQVREVSLGKKNLNGKIQKHEEASWKLNLEFI